MSVLETRRRAFWFKEEGEKKGLSGGALWDYVIEKAGLSKFMDHRNVRKLVKKGEELCKGGEQSKGAK